MPMGLTSSAAERNHFDAGDPEKTAQVERLNVHTPEFLGKVTRERGILLIYISTGTCFVHVGSNSRLRIRWEESAILSR